MIDWNRLEELRVELGPDSFAEIIGLFIEEADAETTAIRLGRPSREISASLHFLKGAALNLGLSELANLCREGERLADPGFDAGPVLRCYDLSRAALLAGLDARVA